MAGKRVYNAEIVQIRVNQTNLYHQQWAIPRGDKRPYIVSETILKENGEYVRKHRWICGCMDWTRRRQKLPPPEDRCKHVDAVIRDQTSQIVLDSQTAVFGNVKQIQTIPSSEFEGYEPFLSIICGWSGQNIRYKHIIKLPRGAIPITIENEQSFSYTVGYIKGDTAYLSLIENDIGRFDYKTFFSVVANRLYSPEESELLLQMEEQRDRLEKNFGVSITNEAFIFQGDFTDHDRKALDRLVKSTTIDEYQMIGSSLILKFNNRAINYNGRQAWKGDYLIIIGKSPQFSVMGKNIKGSNHYRGNGAIHPHVSSAGFPCLATYNQLVVKALDKRNWINFAMIVSDFLTQYNPQSPYIKL